MRAIHGATIVCVLFVCFGCKRTSDSRAGTATLTAADLEHGRRLLNDDAAMIVTKVRCHRIDECGDIGPGARFADRDACLHGLFPQNASVVAPTECPAGVGEASLSRCVAALNDQACYDARAGTGDPAACMRASLCASPAEP